MEGVKNAAVVGLGIGLAHCAGYLGSSRARLRRVCDLQEERLSGPAGTFAQGSMTGLKTLFTAEELHASWEDLGVVTGNSLDEVLADPEIDIVSLCTPDYQHAEQALRVLAAGKHLLLEKPVALDMEGAGRVLEAAAEAGRHGIRSGVGYEFRLNPAIRALRELIPGVLGKPRAFSLHHFRTPFKRDKWEHWIQREELSGGLIVEETSHWFDLARYIVDREPKSLHCVTTGEIHQDFDYEDVAYINGTYEDGAILQLAHSLTGFDFSLVLQVHGTEGTAWCGLKESPYTSLDGGQTHHLGLLAWGPSGARPEEAHVRSFGEEATEPENIRDCAGQFAAAVAGEGDPLCSVAEGVRALELSLIARDSARAGGEVRPVGTAEFRANGTR